MYKNKASSSASGASHATAESQVSESRKRQSKRDDAIRRKIENDLSKKKKSGARASRSKKGAPGTVLSLKPSEPIICKPSATCYEVAQLMTAKRENCILVVSDVGELMGIFTAKDLAFRVVGSGLNATQVTIDQIMTPDPMCAHSNTPASEALNLMVERGFRHLPVVDETDDGSVGGGGGSAAAQIVGVLDITKCYAQQMEKLERMHASSKKLYEALDSVHSELGGGAGAQQPLHVFQYFENLKQKMNGPTLDSVLDASTVPVYSNVKASVYDATLLMREHHTTAVLVKDTSDAVAGIFTSKDVVLRVIAAGLDPKTCSIVRVMTPQPDVAAASLSIQDALRKMFDGHYLNLPVVDDLEQIVGIVDVLRLTYSTLNQIKVIEDGGASGAAGGGDSSNAAAAEAPAAEGTNEQHGPAWNRFWTSLDNNDTDSVHSDSITGVGSGTSGIPEITPSEFNSFNVDNIKPSDSISYINSPKRGGRRSSRLPRTHEDGEGAGDDDDDDEDASVVVDTAAAFIFKFKSPALDRVHRVSVAPDQGVAKLHELIDSKLSARDLDHLRVATAAAAAASADAETYAVSYIDDEGDVVSITTDHDLIECVRINKVLKNDKADLYIHNPHEAAVVAEKKAQQQQKGKAAGAAAAHDLIPGVPNEVLIPGALAVLAGSIVVGLILGRK